MSDRVSLGPGVAWLVHAPRVLALSAVVVLAAGAAIPASAAGGKTHPPLPAPAFFEQAGSLYNDGPGTVADSVGEATASLNIPDGIALQVGADTTHSGFFPPGPTRPR